MSFELSLNLSTPHSIGSFETGCHTHNGNDFVLYVETTYSLSEELKKCFEMTYKYMKSKRFADSDSIFYHTLRGVKKDTIQIQFLGVWILNDAYNALANRLTSFYKVMINKYCTECELDYLVSANYVKSDVFNYFFRQYEYWLAERAKKDFLGA